ncbi:ATP-dependent helicase [Thermoproteota archaeon]
MITTKDKPNTAEELLGMLNPTVKDWFFTRFKEFSLPQLFGVFEIHSRNNILISAPTGATKTLTGFLSILNELVDSSQKGLLEDRIYAVYVSPLRALSRDIQHNLKEPLKEIEKIHGKQLGIKVMTRTGDTTPSERAKMAKNPPHILITTPESLAIMLQTKSFRNHLRGVSWAIVDEIHALAENKRGVHLSLTMEMLERISPGICRVGLSATVAPLDEIGQFLVGKDRPCKIVDVQFIKDMDLKVISPVTDLINTTYEDTHRKLYSLMDGLIQEHKTTLIFTNTRSATERVVHYLKIKFPSNYTDVLDIGDDKDFEANVDEKITGLGAHHGSLSRTHRHKIENGLREGKLKAVVCSTSLELGIDIGYIDLVILLGSPKSVSRALQRIGRSGHQLHSTTKGRIIVLDRDDLIECSVLLKSAVEKKIDKIHIPTNALDVLSQQIYGICITEKMQISELAEMVRKSYCYKDLTDKDFYEVIKYLTGEHVSLEDRHVYAKIWFDEETGMVGRRGRLARVIYMTNIGTIPDQTGIKVKIGAETIGTIQEPFLERLKKGDIFILGGNTYQFQHSRGTVAQVRSAIGKKPTVPSWFSEMLPLSFDLAKDICRFRRLMNDKFEAKMSKKDVLDFINSYLYVDDNAAKAVYRYMKEQYDYSEIPTDKKIIIEHYTEENKKYAVFHTLFGRRVNDCLSRAVAFAISKLQQQDVEIGITDNGFYIASNRNMQAVRAINMLESGKLRQLLEMAIDKTQVLSRRFRHCAGRALMILRNYKGHTKRVGKQQVSSMILLSAVRRISKDFPILKESRREVLEDLMDIENAEQVIREIEKNKIEVKTIDTSIPSPFAFNLVLQGHIDIMRMEDRVEFLKRMHQLVMAKISLKQGKAENRQNPIDYKEFWKEQEN